MSTMSKSTQDVVNDGLSKISDFRTFIGKDRIYEAVGVVGCKSNCVVAANMGIRCKVGSASISVRSRVMANRVIEALDLKGEPLRMNDPGPGMKDFPWLVVLPHELTELIRRFDRTDGGHVQKLNTTSTIGYTKATKANRMQSRAILKIRSTKVPTTVVETDAEGATKLFKALFN